MAENLNFETDGSLCNGNGDNDCNIYGRYYNWSTATGLSSECDTTACSDYIRKKHRGICPEGWHIPSQTEWNVLKNFVDSKCEDNNPCKKAGTKLKSKTGWYTGSGYIAGTDDYGFSVLPGGAIIPPDDTGMVGQYSYLWSATEGNIKCASSIGMENKKEDASWNCGTKSLLFSVRCLQD